MLSLGPGSGAIKVVGLAVGPGSKFSSQSECLPEDPSLFWLRGPPFVVAALRRHWGKSWLKFESVSSAFKCFVQLLLNCHFVWIRPSLDLLCRSAYGLNFLQHRRATSFQDINATLMDWTENSLQELLLRTNENKFFY